MQDDLSRTGRLRADRRNDYDAGGYHMEIWNSSCIISEFTIFNGSFNFLFGFHDNPAKILRGFTFRDHASQMNQRVTNNAIERGSNEN